METLLASLIEAQMGTRLIASDVELYSPADDARCSVSATALHAKSKYPDYDG